MPRKTRRTFLAAVPAAAALAAPAAASPARGAAQAPATGAKPVKRVYRKITPTSKTVKGQPLYSPEVSFGNLVFVSGKGPGVGFKGDIRAQTTNVLDQIEESLKLAGSSMDKVLKVNVYLTNMKDFEGMNEAYIGRFGDEPPVRTTVSVVDIPDHTLVEIDCIAYV